MATEDNQREIEIRRYSEGNQRSSKGYQRAIRGHSEGHARLARHYDVVALAEVIHLPIALGDYEDALLQVAPPGGHYARADTWRTTKVIRGHQKPSSGGNHAPSDAIRRHRMPSVAIKSAHHS